MAFPLMLIIYFVFIYLFTYFVKLRKAQQQQARLHSNICARFHPVALQSILRSVGHEQAEQHANNRVEFSKQLHTHVFVKEEAAKQRNYTFGGVCTKVPVSKLRPPSILRTGSGETRANNRVVEFRKEYFRHVFDKGLPAKQRSKTYLVHLCPCAPSRKKYMVNVLERQRYELESCNLAARFDELQVEKEEHVEDLCVEEVVEFDPQDDAVEEVQFNDVGLRPADQVVLQGKNTTLQRETAALSDYLGAYWSRASPRCLTRSSRARKQPDRFISSF